MGAVPTPLGARLLIAPDAEEVSDIIISPETAYAGRPTSGRVIARGQDAIGFHVGCRVAFAATAGHDYKFNGKEFLILPTSEVDAVIKDG